MEKQNSILAMIKGKIDNLHKVEGMFSEYSILYLYDVAANPESELKTDYLLVRDMDNMVLQLGMIEAENRTRREYHCNSFMVDYKKNDNYDKHYRNLTRCYQISKIVREDKKRKWKEVIYQSEESVLRETMGIEKMLRAENIQSDEKLVNSILRLNKEFGEYHTLELLKDFDRLRKKCHDRKKRFWQKRL